MATNETAETFSQRQARNGALGAAARWKDHVKVTSDSAQYHREYQKAHRESLNKRQKEARAKTPFVSRKKNAQGERYESDREYHRRWRIRNPEKNVAHMAVGRAVKSGQLIKGPCRKCGVLENVHGHHHNGYENRLDVVWLCARHHREEHAQDWRD